MTDETPKPKRRYQLSSTEKAKRKARQLEKERNAKLTKAHRAKEAKARRKQKAEDKAEENAVAAKAKAKAANEIVRVMTNPPKKKGKVITQDTIDTAGQTFQNVLDDGRTVIFQPNPGPQTDFLAAPEKEILYGGSAGGGKAQPLSAKILTPEGFKTIGEVGVGDIVYSPDGTTTKVVQEHPQGTQDIYLVTFQDGSNVECTGDHLWEYTIAGNSSSILPKVRDTKSLQDYTDKQYSKKRPRWALVPLIQQFDFGVSTNLVVPPYTLGALLGDGSITTDSVGLSSADEEIVNRIRQDGVVVTKRSSKYAWGVLGQTQALRDLKLLGTNSLTKFIPENYKKANTQDRICLLQGLMDTDGYASKDSKVYYTSISFTLAEDVAELVRGLGGTATITWKSTHYRCGNVVHEGYTAYTVYIRLRDAASIFNLSRKKARCKVKKHLKNRIVSISYSHREEAKCVTLASEDGLYITDNYIVTHNSYGMLMDPLRYMHRPAHRALLIRKSMPELMELIDLSMELYPKAFPGAKYNKGENRWKFPSGATLLFGFCDADADVGRYIGQSYSWIGVDELTLFATPYVWDTLRSRLRTTDPEITPYMRATTNPGQIGAWWVKKMFIDPAPWGEPFWGRDIETGEILRFPDSEFVPEELRNKKAIRRRFIPARLTDNPYLMQSPEYMANLASMSTVQRKRLLEGDWDISDSSAFPEFDKSIHAVEQFVPPADWPRFRACDYGYSAPAAVIWFAVDYDGTVYAYRELYQKGLDGVALAEKIHEIEAEEPPGILGILDNETWAMRGQRGPSIAEEMINLGVRWIKADKGPGSRVNGKVALHKMFSIDPVTELPRLRISTACDNLLRILPMLPLDKNNPEDVDTKFPEDHLYDALRYGVTSRLAVPARYIVEAEYFSSTANAPQMADPVFGY